jgi:hypothetical protein
MADEPCPKKPVVCPKCKQVFTAEPLSGVVQYSRPKAALVVKCPYCQADVKIPVHSK